jgi:hypothetical protein
MKWFFLDKTVNFVNKIYNSLIIYYKFAVLCLAQIPNWDLQRRSHIMW